MVEESLITEEMKAGIGIPTNKKIVPRTGTG